MRHPDLDPRAAALLDFWFGAHDDDATVAAAQAPLWWQHHAEADREVKDRFGGLADHAEAGALDAWAATPHGLLALVLLLDQAPRMVHRGTPRAFATDRAARALTRTALARGFDRELRPIEQLFVLLPLEHSETLADQEEAVERLRALEAAVPPAWRETFEGFTAYAVAHRDVIARFGRFPHRNEILGRESTDAERAYLAEPGAGF
jgi:uncharacterized protein (DUF924 family)